MASNVTVKARYFNGKKESNESLIRKFKKKCEKAGVLLDLKRHEEYTKPSVARKLKSKLARQRKEKEDRKKQERMERFVENDKPQGY